MNIILLEKIRNLGGIGAIVAVKPGYARNYLIPTGKAKRATKDNISQIEAERASLELREQEFYNKALARKEAIEKLNTIIIHAKSSDEGKLFGSVGTKDIASALTKSGIEVLKGEISLPQGVIRQIGESEVALLLHSDVSATIKVKVVAAANDQK